MHYCYQEKETGAVLFLGDWNRGTTVNRRRNLVLYCSQEKETRVLLFLRRRKLVLYCYQEKETGAALFIV